MKITNFLIPVIPTIHPNWLETLSLVLLGICYEIIINFLCVKFPQIDRLSNPIWSYPRRT